MRKKKQEMTAILMNRLDAGYEGFITVTGKTARNYQSDAVLIGEIITRDNLNDVLSILDTLKRRL